MCHFSPMRGLILGNAHSMCPQLRRVPWAGCNITNAFQFWKSALTLWEEVANEISLLRCQRIGYDAVLCGPLDLGGSISARDISILAWRKDRWSRLCLLCMLVPTKLYPQLSVSPRLRTHNVEVAPSTSSGAKSTLRPEGEGLISWLLARSLQAAFWNPRSRIYGKSRAKHLKISKG